MAHLVRIATLALIMAAIVGGLLGGAEDAAAAGGQAGWVAATDGCSYYSDGSVYAAAACPGAGGGLDFYAAADGAWAYLYSAGYTADGGMWVALGGVVYDLSGATSAEVAALEGMIAAQAGTIGGTVSGSGSGSGGLAEGSGQGGGEIPIYGNAAVDRIMNGARTHGPGVWVAPDCVDHLSDSDTCVVYR